jgi:hypothetical protein
MEKSEADYPLASVDNLLGFFAAQGSYLLKHPALVHCSHLSDHGDAGLGQVRDPFVVVSPWEFLQLSAAGNRFSHGALLFSDFRVGKSLVNALQQKLFFHAPSLLRQGRSHEAAQADPFLRGQGLGL